MRNYYLRLLRWLGVGEERVDFVGEVDGYRIFAIPHSSVSDTGIKIVVKGYTVATYRHFAVDSNNNTYIYDYENKKVVFFLGESEILELAENKGQKTKGHPLS